MLGLARHRTDHRNDHQRHVAGALRSATVREHHDTVEREALLRRRCTEAAIGSAAQAVPTGTCSPRSDSAGIRRAAFSLRGRRRTRHVGDLVAVRRSTGDRQDEDKGGLRVRAGSGAESGLRPRACLCGRRLATHGSRRRVRGSSRYGPERTPPVSPAGRTPDWSSCAGGTRPHISHAPIVGLQAGGRGAFA